MNTRMAVVVLGNGFTEEYQAKSFKALVELIKLDFSKQERKNLLIKFYKMRDETLNALNEGYHIPMCNWRYDLLKISPIGKVSLINH